mgnify:CR=1 FL=1
MIKTIKHGDSDILVVVAKLLTGNVSVTKKVSDPEGFIKKYREFDAGFVASVLSWQKNHNLTPDGIIGPATWTAIAKTAQTCSTSKLRTSGITLAAQILVDSNLTTDAIYGDRTKNAIAVFQNVNGLTADGICGPKTWAALIGKTESSTSTTSGGTGAGQTTTGGKTLNNCVHYLQWDSKWKNVKYSTHTSSQTIGNSGCGPSAMAQIMATFIDAKITPVEMCKLSVDNGFRTYNSGTAWGFFEFVFKKYSGFRKFIKTTSIPTLKAALADGALAVCSMNSNDNHFWTSSGHFVTAIGFDDAGYIYANDPNKKECPRKQKEDKFKSCLKQAFIFWPQDKEESADPFEEAGDVTGKEIIDISYHKGTIDFDALKPCVSLVIPRASIGSDQDTRFVEYATAMNQRRIPFGVFCYSYARDAAKGEDEAVKIVKYASEFDPLFYVIDMEQTCITQEGVRAFVKTLRDIGIKRVGAYVAHHRYNDYRFDELRDLFDFVWIPRYAGNDVGEPTGKRPDFECDLWQYTEHGKIDGINGNVDKSVITGDGKSLEWFLGGE